MAKYTMELRQVLKLGYNPFDFDYTFYGTDEQRKRLEQMWCDHYNFREIGEETIDRWLFKVRTRVMELIDVYNKKWQANALEVDPLSNNKGKSRGRVVFNDTPNSRLDNDDYATTITDNEIENEGYTGATGTDLLNNYLDGQRDIDMEYINEFSDLFILLY